MIYSGVCVGGGGGGPWGCGFKNCGFADFFKPDRKSDCACSHRVFFFMVSIIFDVVVFCCTPVSSVLINLIKLNH